MALLGNSLVDCSFFDTQGIVFDSCGVTWFLNRPSGIAELHSLQQRMSLIVPLPVFYEVGFGKQEDVSESEKRFRQIFRNGEKFPF